MLTYLLASALIPLTLYFEYQAGYGDGITDSRIREPGFHDEDTHDPWHYYSRAQTYTSHIAGALYIILLFTLWQAAASITLLMPISNFLGFRFGVMTSGKYGLWYGTTDPHTLKGYLSRLVRIISERRERHDN